MYIELTITAVADRDPSCNLFTFTETHSFSYHDKPLPSKIKVLCEDHKRKFTEAWPHRGSSMPILIPLDASIRVCEGRMP